MAKSASAVGRGASGRSLGHHINSWHELVAAFKRRLLEGVGAALVLLSFIVVVALLTYNPTDPSFNTAAEASTHNFLGHDGAILADLLVQSLGLAAFLIPAVLLGWAFRLLLQRPLTIMGRRCLLLLPALLFGAFACSVLHRAPLPMPAGVGGMVGWEVSRLV